MKTNNENTMAKDIGALAGFAPTVGAALLRREEEADALRSLCAKLRKQNDENHAALKALMQYVPRFFASAPSDLGRTRALEMAMKALSQDPK